MFAPATDETITRIPAADSVDMKIQEFRDATADAANLLQQLMEDLRVDSRAFQVYLSIALGDSTIMESVHACKSAIRRRRDAQEAMLVALNRKAGA